MLDPLSLVNKEERADDGRTWYTCNPEIIYPAVIARIQEIISSGELPDELVDHKGNVEIDPRGIARTYASRAKALPLQSWDYALQARDKIQDAQVLAIRAEALNLARLWFTQALHVSVGGNGTALGMHWTNSPECRS